MSNVLSKESIQIIVLLAAGLFCLAVLIVPLILDNRNNNKNR